ncbi:hypothetical protein ASF58_24620 [Methylobacterium sp. Leaf125]|uniref:hypothetical protein n=1 Tax=Methylobacterium sp. Leaf125 TaxID=1736265 RepID=UPI0006FBE00C|nr:hypothetical protein [Methylobacterium sp. Leaf125]KQQ27021.1 hypothetical protein ASF58_24620 [Methylobacterium sp. Leaf125]
MNVERLSILLSWAGERAAALAALCRADALMPGTQEIGRIILFDLLLAKGLRAEAAERTDWRNR